MPEPKYTRVAMYLRKSRRDEELEQVGAEDTLERHRRILLTLAKQLGLTVTQIYQEVVSGDTIEARPQMRRLLADVEDGCYDAVICHDIDRLGRGGMRDQGQILDTFKWSHTAIITPDRTYNLDSEMDEEMMEYKAQGARFEYRMIKKRLARGREQSVREGKFIGHTPPYGYERVKLQGQKGWTLAPVEPQAQTVRDIYRWYTADDGRIGVSLIVRRLNDRGIPSPGGMDWLPVTVRAILANPVYAGMIRTKSRPAKKIMKDGVLTVTRPREAGKTFPGLHPALVTKETSDRALALLASNPGRPGPKQVSMKNPLSGLVYCADCGRAMVRRPYGSGYPDSLMCPYTSCACVSSQLDTVEEMILESLQAWLTRLSLDADSAAPGADESSELQSIQTAIDAAEAEQSRLSAQRSKAYDLVEQGIYTTDVFTARMQSLSDQLQTTAAQLAHLQEERARLEQTAANKRNLLPAIRHVLDAYPLTSTPEEKNTLLKTVLSKVIYKKTRRTRSLSGSDLSLQLIPRI